MKKNTSPNILLIVTDQQRGDALGIDGHPVLQTPFLDHMAASGSRFRHAYSACPVCIPARRTLMSGQKPVNHGVTMNYHTILNAPTLPELLANNDFQTHLCGKLHLWPLRKMYGFQSADWSDGPHNPGNHNSGDDYQKFLRQNGVQDNRPGVAHGVHISGWTARPWHMEERLHPTNWVTDKALDFLDRRDPTRPFFLNVSYFHPHQPCTPPAHYWDRYIHAELPIPKIGDWAKVYDNPNIGQPVDSWRTALTPMQQQQYQAGYYGCINHIDDQIGRLLAVIPRNTIICFVSDHGEMLGDHQWIRKRLAYEGSARIPFLMWFPKSFEINPGIVLDDSVELMDVMPTLLEAVGIPLPEGIDGVSLMPLLNGETSELCRKFIHGECAEIPTLNSGMQYLTDGKVKYIRYPGTGLEEFFNLEQDPNELCNLIDDPLWQPSLTIWRERLIDELSSRPEKFVDNGDLEITGGPASYHQKGYERNEVQDCIREDGNPWTQSHLINV